MRGGCCWVTLLTLCLFFMVQENDANLIRNLAIIIYNTRAPLFVGVVCVLSPEIDMALSCGPPKYLFPLLIHSSPLFSFSLSRSPTFSFLSKEKGGRKPGKRRTRKGGLMKEKRDKNLTQRMVGWWSCRIKLARSQEIGSICMCYAMRIHKSPIACKGKSLEESFFLMRQYFVREVRKSPSLASFSTKCEKYMCIYFLHLPLLFFRTEIIVMTISVFYKKRTRKLPNTNWGRLLILLLLLYKGLTIWLLFLFFSFWERRGKSRGRDSVQSSLIYYNFWALMTSPFLKDSVQSSFFF